MQINSHPSWLNPVSPFLLSKGLEPEIERIMDKHKADMEEIERGHHVSRVESRWGDGPM